MDFQIQQEPNFDISTPVEEDIGSSITSDLLDITGKASTQITFSGIIIAIIVIFFFAILFNLAYSFLYEACFDGIHSRRKKLEVMGLATLSMILLSFVVIFIVTRRIIGNRKKCKVNKSK
jgi:hypothetical protein